MPFWMWLATGGLLLVIEMLTVNLLFASLAFSALIAAIASALGLNVLIQGALFGLGAAGSLWILRPIALRHLRRSPAGQTTNVDALVGAPAIALSIVTDRDGQVKLSGETWSARSFSGQIEDGSTVEVVAIEGATAVVKRRG